MKREGCFHAYYRTRIKWAKSDKRVRRLYIKPYKSVLCAYICHFCVRFECVLSAFCVTDRNKSIQSRSQSVRPDCRACVRFACIQMRLLCARTQTNTNRIGSPLIAHFACIIRGPPKCSRDNTKHTHTKDGARPGLSTARTHRTRIDLGRRTPRVIATRETRALRAPPAKQWALINMASLRVCARSSLAGAKRSRAQNN